MCFPQVTFSLTLPLQWSIHDYCERFSLYIGQGSHNLTLIFHSILILIKIKDKIYYKPPSNEAQAKCLNRVQIQGQLHKKQWSKQRVWNPLIFPRLHSDCVPFQCKVSGKSSSWWGRGAHLNGWREIRGNQCSTIKLNEVKVICRKERNPGCHVPSQGHPKYPQPSQFPSHTSATLKTLPWPCLVSTPNGLRFCLDKNVHQRKRVLIK